MGATFLGTPAAGARRLIDEVTGGVVESISNLLDRHVVLPRDRRQTRRIGLRSLAFELGLQGVPIDGAPSPMWPRPWGVHGLETAGGRSPRQDRCQIRTDCSRNPYQRPERPVSYTHLTLPTIYSV